MYQIENKTKLTVCDNMESIKPMDYKPGAKKKYWKLNKTARERLERGLFVNDNYRYKSDI